MKSIATLPSLFSSSLASIASLGLRLKLWVSLCVTGLSVFCAQVGNADLGSTQGLPPLWSPVFGVVFLASLALYNLDNSLDSSSGLPGSADARRLHGALSLISFTGLAWLLHNLAVEAQVLTAVGFAVCCMYALPLGAKGKPKGIKSLPGIKGPFVGLAVATAAVWTPALSGTFSPKLVELVPLTLVIACYCTANALLFDLPDICSDARGRIPTAPVVVGVEGTRKMCITLCASGMLLWPISAVISPSAGSPRAGFANLVSLTVLGMYLIGAAFWANEKTPKTRIAYLIDGSLLFPLLIRYLLLS